MNRNFDTSGASISAQTLHLSKTLKPPDQSFIHQWRLQTVNRPEGLNQLLLRHDQERKEDHGQINVSKGSKRDLHV
jgi:hypothetical protein